MIMIIMIITRLSQSERILMCRASQALFTCSMGLSLLSLSKEVFSARQVLTICSQWFSLLTGISTLAGLSGRQLSSVALSILILEPFPCHESLSFIIPSVIWQDDSCLIRYPIFMDQSKGWWMILLVWCFCFCIGSLLFSVTDLGHNHVCTYTFIISRYCGGYLENIHTSSSSREQQLSTLVCSFITTIIVFLIYAAILVKFYRRKKNYENFREESFKVFYTKVNPIKFSGTVFFIIPVRLPLPLNPANNAVVLKQMNGEHGRNTRLSEMSEIEENKKSISRHFSFHISYIKSSNYVLVILLSYLIFHAPLFIYQASELVRLARELIMIYPLELVL